MYLIYCVFSVDNIWEEIDFEFCTFKEVWYNAAGAKGIEGICLTICSYCWSVVIEIKDKEV